MTKGSVAIVGCGWLGLPLAKRLLADGYRVLGTTTSADKLSKLRGAGIEPFVLSLPTANFNEGANVDDGVEFDRLWSADQLVLNIPPGRHAASAKTYPAAVLSAVLAFRRNSPSGRIVFVSSTGVYGDAKGYVDEETPLTSMSPRATKLILAEAQVTAQAQRPAVIVRLGGLYGGDRHPGNYLAGRQDIPDGDAPVNLTSRDLATSAIHGLLDHPFWTRPVKNVVDAAHPTRRAFYTAFAREHALEEPTFIAGGGDGKIVGTVW